VNGFGPIGGWAADLLLGDPRHWHPVSGFGAAALALEGRIYAPSRLRGALFCLSLVAFAGLVGELGARATRLAGLGRSAALAAVLWATLGGRSLALEARRIADLLERGELEAARGRLPALVGRDVERLSEPQVCRAVVESVAENTADAVVGALLWGALAGPAGAAAFRAANTLDAMFGHRNERYAAFGWASARLDDLMAWPAARAGAALAALCAPLVGGSPHAAWATLRRDGALHPSPNSGRMEASFAGALEVRLGGPLSYGERVEHRPRLGDGGEPAVMDIRRAATLSLAVGATTALACACARIAWDGGWGWR
jgi:adenosylcobinamide-phosphate synthase